MSESIIKHRILEKNIETRRGLCAFCGEVALKPKKRKSGGFSYLCQRAAMQWMGSFVTKLNFSLDAYDAMFKEQGGLCAICRRPERNGRFLAVDHDHLTSEIRGLLCTQCNAGLGLLGDTYEALERAANYLKRPKK